LEIKVYYGPGYETIRYRNGYSRASNSIKNTLRKESFE
jgi:hypothetical protein